MDLVDNYLGTIRWNLPRVARADDILAELRDVIAQRIEDHEEALGRALDRAETAKLLSDFGHPLLVAARYGTQQALIGPDIYPFYIFSLKIVLAISIAFLLLSTGAGAVFGSAPAMRTVMQAAHGAFWTLLGHAGLVTLIFAVVERTGWLTEHLQSWSPEQLPDLRRLEARPKSAWEPLVGIAMGIAALAWWAGLLHVPLSPGSPRGLTVSPGAVWQQFHWPILALIAAHLLLDALRLVRPRRLGLQAALTCLLAVAGVAVLTLIYRAGNWVVLVPTTMAPARVARIEQSLHHGLKIALLVIAAIWIGQALGALWRYYTARRG